MKIYTVTTDDENGPNVAVFTDEATADNAAMDFVKRNWRPDDGPMPADVIEALKAYQGKDPENLIWYESHEIDTSSVTHPIIQSGPTMLTRSEARKLILRRHKLHCCATI